MIGAVEFIGERLLPGNLGHGAVILSLMASLLAAISYFRSEQSSLIEDKSSWLKLGRWAFIAHVVAVVTIFLSLFYIIYNHLNEYHYAWSHSSKALPVYYIISSFWEGQEGSFLLWMVWHALLGLVLMGSARKWEAPVMSVVSLTQFMLSSMLLGVYILEYKVGSSPFILLREAMQAPIFQQADYLKYIADGNGLNPLLQNPWMVIHPPVVFLGFATTVVPFAFVVAALWRRDYQTWVAPTVPWTLFSAMVLGTGIIMGGMWAYESLTFGGYWAWDPVENASLVPWLIIIAAVHTLLIFKKTGRAMISSMLLLLFTFVLILYATFLTRSGILGNSSVHSFTDLGMSGQLLVFLLMFLFLGLSLFLWRRKELPKVGSEEHILSREFWMFIGTLILVMSAFQVFLTTSTPVFNKITGSNIAPPADVISHYNRWQLPIVILILITFTYSQFMKFKSTPTKTFWLDLMWPVGISLLVSGFFIWYFELTNWQFNTLLVAAIFGVIGNGQLLIRKLSKLSKAGAAFAHVGFAMMMWGVLISSAKKEVVSINQSGMSYGENFDDKGNHENVLLWKQEPLMMNGYRLTYLGDSTSAPNTFYQVRYEKLNEKKEVVDQFVLAPFAQINPKMGLISSPDTRHFLGSDLYTHVTQIPDPAAKAERKSWKDPVPFDIKAERTDTLMVGQQLMIYEGLSTRLPADMKAKAEGAEVAVMARFRIRSLDNQDRILQPVFAIRGGAVLSFESEDEAAGIRIKINSLNPDKGTLNIAISEKIPESRDYLIMKAMVFPWINMLWAGTVVLIIGFSISVMHRYHDAKREEARGEA